MATNFSNFFSGRQPRDVVELRINRSFEDHLQFPDDKDGFGLRHACLLAIRPPRAAASSRIFD